ncbi:MAG: hypothetical protein GY765_32330 [bacterium]|nr:hypothetical protein [bacterium]
MKESCQHIKPTFPDYLTGDLDARAIESLREHVQECAACRDELEELTGTWTQLGVLPEMEPDAGLRKNFYTMLDSYQEGLNKPSWVKVFFARFAEKMFPRRPAYQFMLVVLVLLVGFVGGTYYTSFSAAVEKNNVLNLQDREQAMRQDLSLALLEQPSPSRRLKGLQVGAGVKEPRPRLLEALLNTLDTDPNVNVRLSAVDALYLFAGTPMVRKGITESLARQKSPLIQVALIDLLHQMREKRAIDALKALMKVENLNPAVKEHAQTALKSLI